MELAQIEASKMQSELTLNMMTVLENLNKNSNSLYYSSESSCRYSSKVGGSLSKYLLAGEP